MLVIGLPLLALVAITYASPCHMNSTTSALPTSSRNTSTTHSSVVMSSSSSVGSVSSSLTTKSSVVAPTSPNSASPTMHPKPSVTTSNAAVSAVPASSTGSGAQPTIFLAGDSTMAQGGGGSGTNGWGQYLGYSMGVPVVNKAMAGRSARSYTREGRFDEVAALVKNGDFVIMEMGHNDGGSLTPTDNGRADCPGTGAETCATTFNGVAETVLTFPAYLTNAAKLLQSKGATVVISSQTPNNPVQGGSFAYTPSRFVGLAALAANTSNALYIDHGGYVAAAYKAQQVASVNQLFPHDHTHTSPAGADIVAGAFVKALLCGGGPLKGFVKNATLPGNCL